jgi:hypothetical protein
LPNSGSRHSTLDSCLSLCPTDLQFVLDLLDPIQTEHDFLGHLLLEERANGAFNADVAIGGFDTHLMGGNVRAVGNCALNLIQERRGI